ncbi:hypothetical protein QAD02_005757 [Eretmocerus hayati]|uniref:Uncharacterized protein n=1 Tax=Eretmocerus hayati TaxID=131215 RepID=A0ACC2NTE7_9HYME|nr:hypothetical protein QAD02_005757 [Eretmocerus hayati]
MSTSSEFPSSQRVREGKLGEEADSKSTMRRFNMIPASTEGKLEHEQEPYCKKDGILKRIALVEHWLATSHPSTHLNPEMRTAMTDEQASSSAVPESQPLHVHPRRRGATLPHDPAPNSGWTTLAEGEARVIENFSTSLAKLALNDVSTNSRTQESGSNSVEHEEGPSPSSDEEGSHRDQPRCGPSRGEGGKSSPVSGNGSAASCCNALAEKYGGRGPTNAPIGSRPPRRMQHRRSRAERAARNAAWARPVPEHRPESNHLDLKCPFESTTRAPNFVAPIFFKSVPRIIMVFIDRDELFEHAENYYLAKNTDTEDNLLDFVRGNRRRRRNRDRVARHRERRNVAARREDRLAQEREREFNDLIAQILAPAQHQLIVPHGDDAPAHRRAPRRRARPEPVLEQQPCPAAQIVDRSEPAVGIAAAVVQEREDDAMEMDVQEFPAAARGHYPEGVNDVFDGLLHFAPRPVQQQPAIAPMHEQEHQEYHIDLGGLAEELPAMGNEPVAVQVLPEEDDILAALQNDDLPAGGYQAEFLQEVIGERPALRMRIRRMGVPVVDAPAGLGDLDISISENDNDEQRNEDSGRDTDHTEPLDDEPDR